VGIEVGSVVILCQWKHIAYNMDCICMIMDSFIWRRRSMRASDWDRIPLASCSAPARAVAAASH